MIRAIIADDEPAVAEILTYFIRKNNLPIEIVGIAEDGTEAVELIQKEKPKLVFLDIQMPRQNGFEVMESVNGEALFIIITAFESFDYAQKALRLGASDILLKPIHYEQLMEALNRTIGFKITDNPMINEIVAYLHGHYSEKIDLSTLAQIVCSSPSQIARLFKKYMGCTVITYLHQLRVDKAAELLKNNVSVKEAAFQVGYESLNNFYKYFKVFKGTTPGDFVRECVFHKDY